ncbi:hypothetical protein A3C59_00655 [Candidatus Daviesbacteria bacterium RIFCSPHIGHO2_02_FULL_36_13]|uniref:Glycosyltransferase 2-like domain-containing protein n=1 Tax=Candidatus Daviesbacteria bacterium RIFCSPHIGHO2_02_FULL_36_13 TaxID=1797768 RepID=A0A1F5JPJ4_9BACT|nr:MAG: hypothetical protein A3C59_00655 [Candidatus Daviesbacteria bacterium RIFCSPHIGHO2_02_FULL_36_13]OGE41725.1 MAG: hypothetical protein A3A45_03710 [Candidatus Daviesbacteria bacterium RIFCSPLOWO2_01_FULL_36_8]
MLSVVVLTKNEEERITACLESVKWADEIIVIDSNSSDKTPEIAKKYTEKVITLDTPDFDIRRNRGIEEAKGKWVLYLDADERVLAPLKEELENIMEKEEFSAVALSRRNVIFGKEVNYGPYKKDWMVRFFKKSDFGGWYGKVHESSHFKGKLGYTKNSLLHLTHRDVDQIVLKSLEWSKIDAKLRLEAKHPPMSGWRFLRIFISEVFNQGIKRGGFFNGTIGMMDSLLQVFSMIISYVRLWQLQQPKEIKEIYKDIDADLIKNKFNY